MIRYLTVVAMIHYLWLMFGSSVLAGTDPSITDGQLDSFGGITSAEDGSTLKAGPAAGLWNGGNSGSINVLVDSSASGHYFDDPLIPGLRYKLANYQVLDEPRKITSQLDGVARGLLRGNVVDGDGVQRLV